MYIDQKTDLESSHQLLQFIERGILIVDSEGTVIFCNEFACNTLNKKQHVIVGQKIGSILPVDFSDISRANSDTLNISLEEKQFQFDLSPIYHSSLFSGIFITFQEKNGVNEEYSLKQTIEKYESALNLLSECILGVDEKGRVNFLSRSYAQLLGIEDPNAVIGKHCTEVVENTRMHIVIETGKTEIGHLMRIGNKKVIATRIPIFENGRITGAIGKIMFHDVDEVKILANRIEQMESKIEFYEKEIKRMQGAKYSFQSIIGKSERINEVKHNAKKVAQSRSTVLIKGETGTGKELFAHAIHLFSPRSDGPFIPLNCAAIPKELLEAELFGYESGAFTGAKTSGKPGKFELADNGTLFLDEIGDLPSEMQAKLLRVLERKEIERVGSTKVKSIDVRFIAATNRDLWEMTRQGEFREDLYYRLNVFMLDIPPLRERKEDIILIARHLISKLNVELGLSVTDMDKEVSELFMNYHWPGNIRELENVLERSMNVVENEQVIKVKHLPLSMRKQWKNNDQEGILLLSRQVEMAEKKAIIKALEITGNNKQEAAHLLGIHRASLYRKMERYGI